MFVKALSAKIATMRFAYSSLIMRMVANLGTRDVRFSRTLLTACGEKNCHRPHATPRKTNCWVRNEG